MKEHLIQMKTMSDKAIEAFMQCPCKFYHQQHDGAVNWRQAVQAVVNEVVKAYFKTCENQRSVFRILKLIDHYWANIEKGLFHSTAHYFEVLATVSDYLIQALTASTMSPLLLQEELYVYSKELDVYLALQFEVAEWSDDGFRVKKYLIDDNVSFVQLFKQMVIVFSKLAFKRIPDSIEIHSLLNENTYQFHPLEKDYPSALEELRMMKAAFSSACPKALHSANCFACPYQNSNRNYERTAKSEKSFFYV